MRQPNIHRGDAEALRKTTAKSKPEGAKGAEGTEEAGSQSFGD
jgi:hypothetical protein